MENDATLIFIAPWFIIAWVIYSLGYGFMKVENYKIIVDTAIKSGSSQKYLFIFSYKIIPPEFTKIISLIMFFAIIPILYLLIFSKILFPPDRSGLLIASTIFNMILQIIAIKFLISFKRKHTDQKEFDGPHRAFYTLLVVSPPEISYKILMAGLVFINLLEIYKIIRT